MVATDRVTVTSSVERNDNANVGVVAPGVELVRGFVMIDAQVGDRFYRIANTPLTKLSSDGTAFSGVQLMCIPEDPGGTCAT